MMVKLRSGLVTIATAFVLISGATTLSAPVAAADPSAAPSSATANAWQPTTADQSNDPAVADAIAKTIARTAPQTTWYGPTSGPKPEAGTSLVCMAANAQNAIERLWCDEVKKAAELVGWNVTVIDGKGTAQGWTQGLTQAIALKPKVIIYSADAATLKDLNKQATEQGITVIGIHAAGTPGPHPESYLFSNMTSDPQEIGGAEADYIIADSGGTAKAIILYDSAFEIARMKAEAMKEEFAKCKGCQLLEYVASPIAEMTSRMPQECSNWAAKYGKDWYVMTIYDGYYDFCVPALETAGYGPQDVKLVGSDGTQAAYDRIRSDKFQVATVPEPAQQLALMAVDDAIRAAAGEPPANWTQPVFLHVKANIDTEGGDQDQFYPSNDALDHYKQLWGVE
jgi:ribose transport system substrate-binding protein